MRKYYGTPKIQWTISLQSCYSVKAQAPWDREVDIRFSCDVPMSPMLGFSSGIEWFSAVLMPTSAMCFLSYARPLRTNASCRALASSHRSGGPESQH